MSSKANAILFPLKLLLTSAGALSLASGFKFCVSSLTRFSISQAPTIWTSVRSWLRPPYLYFVINGIIILIVASSRFRYSQRNDDETEDFVGTAPVYEQSPSMSEFNVRFKYETKWTEEEEKNVVAEYGGGREAHVCDEEDKNIVMSENGEGKIPAMNLVSPARFAYRKPVKPSLKGGWIRSRSMRETRSKQQHDTMDETWKRIMAGRRDNQNTNYCNDNNMKAAESPAPAVRLRAEPSLDQEELNRRAEEFIKKFNEDMKLQRQ